MSIDLIISSINKQFKQELVTKGVKNYAYDKIPFSSIRMNYALYGGLPLGKAVEIHGADSSGKTTTALDIIANAQKLYADKVCVFVDTENSFNKEWAKKLGVDTDALILISPQDQTAEQVLQMILDIIDSGDVSVLVLDSIPMLVSQQVFEEALEKKSYAGISAVLTMFSAKISHKLAVTNTLFIGLNQVREDLGNPYNQFSTPGGRGWKHLCAVRLMLRKGSLLDEDNKELKNSDGTPAGNLVECSIVKTKVCNPDRRIANYPLKYDTGIDTVSDLADFAIYTGVITQAGAWFYYGEQKFQGKAKLILAMRESAVLVADLVCKCAITTQN